MPKKKKATSKKEEDSPFFVGIRDPIEIRRSLLESSKEVVQYLQRNERFKEIRKEKADEMGKLKITIEDIQKLMKKVKKELPKTKLRASALKREEAEDRKEAGIQKRIATLKRHRAEELEACRKGQRAVKKAEKEREEKPKEMPKEEVPKESKIEVPITEKPKKLTDLEKLEAELGEIESKLTKIT